MRPFTNLPLPATKTSALLRLAPAVVDPACHQHVSVAQAPLRECPERDVVIWPVGAELAPVDRIVQFGGVERPLPLLSPPPAISTRPSGNKVAVVTLVGPLSSYRSD